MTGFANKVKALEIGQSVSIPVDEQTAGIQTMRVELNRISKYGQGNPKFSTRVMKDRSFKITRIAERKVEKRASVDAGTGIKMGLSPADLARPGTEHAEQTAILQWVKLVWRHDLGRLIFAVPNGGDRQAHVGASMAAEGVKKGVPDLCWPMPKFALNHHAPAGGIIVEDSRLYAGLWIELKTPKRWTGKDNAGCSEQQIKWHADLIEQGYAVAVAYGWQAACWVLKLYADGRLSLPVVEGKPATLYAPPCDDAPQV